MMLMSLLLSIAAVAANPVCKYKSGSETVVYSVVSPKEAQLRIDGPKGKFECEVQLKAYDMRAAIQRGIEVQGDRAVACSPVNEEMEKLVLRDVTLLITVYDGKPEAKINVFRRRAYESCELSNYSAEAFGLPAKPPQIGRGR